MFQVGKKQQHNITSPVIVWPGSIFTGHRDSGVLNPHLLEALDGLADVAADLRELLGPEQQRGDAGDDHELGDPQPEQALAPERAAGSRPPRPRGHLRGG
jgi:hypothetical protein